MTKCHKWTLALLGMVVLAMPSAGSFAQTRIGVAASTKPNADGFVGAGSQSLSAGRTTVEVVVSEKKKPRPDECVTRVRLVEGAGASFTLPSGRTAQLTNPNETICITQNGTVTHGSSSTSILGFQVAGETPPPSITGGAPIPPGVGPPTIPPCVTNCQP